MELTIMCRQRNLPSVLLLQCLHIYGVRTPHPKLTVAIAHASGDAHWGVELIVAHIGRVLGQSLAANDVPPHKYEKALKLLQGLHGLSSISARLVARKHENLAGVCASNWRDAKCSKVVWHPFTTGSALTLCFTVSG